MLLTSALMARLPNWVNYGWQEGDTVNLGDYSNQATAFANKILNDDNFASFVNEHPGHKPS